MIIYLKSTKDYQKKNIRKSEIKAIQNADKIISENGKRHLTRGSILTGGRLLRQKLSTSAATLP
jgi:hypothetical protein